MAQTRRPDGSVGMALVLPALTDCRWWFESLLVHSGVSSATRRKATGADQKKRCHGSDCAAVSLTGAFHTAIDGDVGVAIPQAYGNLPGAHRHFEGPFAVVREIKANP